MSKEKKLRQLARSHRPVVVVHLRRCVEHWANGGTTSVDKAKLFRRPCHTTEHTKHHNQRRKPQ